MGFLSDFISAPLYAFIALMIFIIVLVFIFRFTRKSNLVTAPLCGSRCSKTDQLCALKIGCKLG